MTTNFTEITNPCSIKREPVFITKNGYGDMVVMRMETYDELLETAEAEFPENGELYGAREVFHTLRRKYLG